MTWRGAALSVGRSVGWQQAAPENVLGCCHHPLDSVRSCVRENAFWFRTRWEMAVSGIIPGAACWLTYRAATC
jgi:hypothetical protein